MSLPGRFTVSEEAALTYLSASDRDVRAEALQHLVAICLRASRGRGVFLSDDPGDVSARDWLETWLLAQLWRYQGTAADGLARDGQFRETFQYIGRRATLALLDEARKRNRRARHPAAGAHEGIRTSPARAEVSPARLQTWLWKHREALQGAFGRLMPVLETCLRLRLEDGEWKRADVQALNAAVADQINVRERQARSLVRELQRVAAVERQRGNPALAELHELLGG